MRQTRLIAVVADDDRDIRELLVDQMQAWGFVVYSAADGQATLNLVNTCSPDIVLLDNGMPGMDGIDLIRVMRAQPALSDVPVMIVSATASGEDAARALSAGAYDYIRKPFHLEELRVRVQVAAKRAYLMRGLRSLEYAIAQPLTFHESNGVRASTLSKPAHGAVAGGDFMTVVSAPRGEVAVIMGDVAGHGVSAAALAAFMRVTMANIARFTSHPGDVLDLANQILCERDDDQGRAELVTAACAVVEPVTLRVRWALAGHPAPMLVRDHLPLAAEPGPPLGTFADAHFPVLTTQVEPQASLLFYTDGLMVLPKDGPDFTQVELPRILSETRSNSAEELLDEIEVAHAAFTQGMAQDDLSLMLVQCGPGSSEAAS